MHKTVKKRKLLHKVPKNKDNNLIHIASENTFSLEDNKLQAVLNASVVPLLSQQCGSRVDPFVVRSNTGQLFSIWQVLHNKTVRGPRLLGTQRSTNDARLTGSSPSSSGCAP